MTSSCLGSSFHATAARRRKALTVSSNCKRMCPGGRDRAFANRHGHSQGDAMRDPNFEQCVQACYECAVACDQCAAASLETNATRMKRCIALATDCAAVCRLCAAMLARNGEFSTALCTLCALVCDACARACAPYQDMEHCQICAGACLACTLACQDMLEA
ncbi:four-helix bundle copper-binding protein [Achromobacter sp. AGC39]